MPPVLSPAISRRRLLSAASGIAATSLVGCGGGGDSSDAKSLPDAQRIATDLVSSGSTPGVCTVSLDHESFRIGVAGRRRAESTDPITLVDRFAIGSMTKVMTATLAALQVQAGRLSWGSRLYEAWPELAVQGSRDYADVTLRDLLTHHAGLPALDNVDALLALPPLQGDLRAQRETVLRWALTQDRQPAVGEFGYSNAGYIVVAAWLERLAARDYEGLAHGELFRSLAVQPVFQSPAARGDRAQPWPHLWHAASTRWLALDPDAQELAFPGFANPAGGLSLRPTELTAFLRMHLRALQGRPGSLLSPAVAEQMHTVHKAYQALGWVVSPDLDGRVISASAGSDDHSFYAMMGLSRARGRAAAVLCNGYREDGIAALNMALTRLLD